MQVTNPAAQGDLAQQPSNPSVFSKWLLVARGFAGRALAAAAILQCSAAIPAQTSPSPVHFSHVTFTPPAGWKSSLASGWMLLIPPELQAGQNVFIGVSPGGGPCRALAVEFSDLVKASQGTWKTVQSDAPQSSTDEHGLPTLQQTLVLQDSHGSRLLRYYMGKLNGNRFEAMTYTATPELAQKYLQAFKDFYSQMVYDGAPALGGVTATQGTGAATAAQPQAKGRIIVPEAAPQFAIQPKLYVLAVGVGTYADERVPHLTYPAKDAKDFVASLLKQKGGLYLDVTVKLITDGAATRDAILDGLDWIQKQTTQHDVAMVFISGHGDNDAQGDYYFLPANFNQDKVRSTALNFSEIRTTVEALAGKTLFFVDTCRAGNAIGTGTRRGGSPNITAIVSELANAENGAIVFTACTGKQSALEDAKWGNGAFTLALIEGLSGKAARGGDRITVDMLDVYISERVKELTGGKQTPTTTKPKTVPDFPIAITNVK